MPRLLRRGSPAVLVLALLLTACGGAPPVPPRATKAPIDPIVVVSPGAVGTIPRIDDATKVVLPLDAYRLTPEQHLRYIQALAILVNRCLKPFGFTHPVPAAETDTSTLARSRRYGITNAADAATYGYHFAPNDSAAVRPSPGPPVTPDMLLVWTGSPDGIAAHGPAGGGQSYHGRQVPIGGCAGEAARQLGLDPTIGVGDAQVAALDRDIFAQTQRDARVKDVFRAWSGCLARAGFDAPDPLHIGSLADMKARSASPVEIRMAVADVSCKHETNLVGVWFAVDAADEKEAIAQLPAQFSAIEASVQQAMSNAARVLAAGV
ncbi:MAG: hypothetical protein ACM3JP_00420 [Betaproteobacteria bacterium]